MASTDWGPWLRLAARTVGVCVVVVGGLVLMGSPASADNGPHQTYMGTSVIGGGPDGCAGCHRLHTAAGADYLFRSQTNETQLCANCHGVAGTGATTDVMDGWSYDGLSTSTGLAALRGGGFRSANLGAGAVSRTANVVQSYNLIPGGVAYNSLTTSTHAIDAVGTMWGNGTAGSGTSGVTLECTSCHNPHGNGNFRILRPIGVTATTDQTANNYYVAPVAITSATAAPYTDPATGNTRYNYTYVTSTPHGLRTGQTVGITAALPAAYNKTGTVTSVTDPNTFTLGRQAGNPGGSGSGGYASQAWSANIKNAVISNGGLTVTLTTWQTHGLTAPLASGDTGTTAKGTTRQNTQYVTITGIADAPAAPLNLTQVPITAVPSGTTFVVTLPAAVTATYRSGISGGWIAGVPDSLNKTALGPVVYQQTNFWRADDHSYTGVTQSVFNGPMPLVSAAAVADGAGTYNYTYASAAPHALAVGDQVTITGTSVGSFNLSSSQVTVVSDSTHFTVGFQDAPTSPTATGGQFLPPGSRTSSAFIRDVSQWCSTCHTRYLAATNSTIFASGDSVFTYRHTSNNGGEDNPNCIQCHVAHGSNAVMSGLYSRNLNNPGDTSSNVDSGTAVAGDSRLLRADNRGVCLLCHDV